MRLVAMNRTASRAESSHKRVAMDGGMNCLRADEDERSERRHNIKGAT